MKSTEQGGPRGADAGKVIGRKQFVAVDSLGWLQALWSSQPTLGLRHSAGPTVRSRVKRIKVLWGDPRFDTVLPYALLKWNWVGIVVKKLVWQVGFVVQSKRWIVERTIVWLNRSEHLAKDHKRKAASSEAFIKIVMIHQTVQRLKPEQDHIGDWL